MPGTIEWLAPWTPVRDAAVQRALEEELRRELAKGHTLCGRQAVAVARRCDCDDVLFELGDRGQLAVVHLAWAAHPDRPPWPTTKLFEGLHDFIERRMKPDHVPAMTTAWSCPKGNRRSTRKNRREAGVQSLA